MISWSWNYDIMPRQSLWYHTKAKFLANYDISITVLLHDIIGIWYHSQYHMRNHIWYPEIETMISVFWTYDISITWYNWHAISDFYDIIATPHMISQNLWCFPPVVGLRCQITHSWIDDFKWVYLLAQASLAALAEARSGLKSWMLCALRLPPAGNVAKA